MTLILFLRQGYTLLTVPVTKRGHDYNGMGTGFPGLGSGLSVGIPNRE